MSQSFSTKKVIVFIFACLYAMTGVFAQCRETSQKHKEKAIEYYNNGRFQDAKKLFDVAKACPELSSMEKNNLNEWIEKCDAAIKRKGQNNKPDMKPATISKGEVEFSHLSCSTQCNDQGGISLKLCFQVKGMKGKHIGVRCLLSPERGRPVPRKEFDPTGEYTVYGGKLGVEKKFTASSNEEYFSETFFIPFSVIDFGGEYVTQALDVVFHVFEPCKNSASNNMKPINGGTIQDKFSVTPIAFTLDGGTKNVTIPVNYQGGVYSPRIVTCGCNTQWTGEIPYWITIDDNGMDCHVAENKSRQNRETTLRIVSDAGWGNVITVRIRQSGR